MSDKPAIKIENVENPVAEEQDVARSLKTDVRAVRAGEMRGRISGLGALKISGVSQSQAASASDVVSGSAFDDTEARDGSEQDDESAVMPISLDFQARPVRVPLAIRILNFLSVLGTAAWFFFCLAFLLNAPGGVFTPQALGSFMAGVFAPTAMLWLMVSAMNRRSDVHAHAAALRSELRSLLFPSAETSSQINKDVERLCQQAVEVSAASRAVLKSLQRARQGLRAEIRDFSGVSKKAEFHIERLAESLHERGVRLLSLTEEIDQKTSSIDTKAQAGAEAWDQATRTILDRAAEMEAAMGKGADKILEAADKASDRTKEIEGRLGASYDGLDVAVETMAERLSALSTRFESHTSGIASAADSVSAETERLAEAIRDQIAGLEGVTDRTVEAMSRGAETIQAQRQSLDDGARAVAEQSEKIAVAISGSVEKLGEAIEHVTAKTQAIESRLDEKTVSLRDVVSGITQEAEGIEAAGKVAANQLGEALSSAISGAETIGLSVRRAVESLENAAESAHVQAKDLISVAQERAGDLQSAGQAQADELRAIVDLLGNERAHIEDVSRRTREQVAELAQSIEEQNSRIDVSCMSLAERAEAVRSALADPLKEIMGAVAEADARHEKIESVLGRRVSDLNEAGEKAVASAENIREILKGQAQEISVLSGQISGNARTISEQMGVHKNEISAQAHAALQSMGDVRDALETQVSTLGTITEKAVSDVSGLRTEIETRCREISDLTGEAFGTLGSLDENLDSKIAVLRNQADGAMQSVASIRAALESTAQDIGPICQRAVGDAERVQERFEQLKTGFESMTESKLARLQQIGVVFDERLDRLKSGAEEASEILRSSGDGLRERTEEIQSASTTASERMRDISSSLSGQVSDIHLLTDQAMLKIEKIQSALNEQFHDLSASVGQAVSRIHEAGAEFSRQSEILQDETGGAGERFESAGMAVRNEVALIQETSRKVIEDTRVMVRSVQEEATNLLAKASDTLLQLRKSGDSFAIRAHEMGEQMKSSLGVSEKYGRELRGQAGLVAEASGQSVEQLNKALAALKLKMDEVGNVAGDVSQKVERSREKLAGESERLLSVSTAALESARDAAVTFGKQSESLFKASQDASHFAEEVRKKSLRAEREGFMGAAKFIVESLHSLSFDLTRMLDGEISEKTWKAFQKGDVAAFTRRLSAMEGKLPLEKAREKFAKDSEFRNYVQRFLRQFEELYIQACENDHGALLSAAIASSEVGKLYEFLCSVAGKESLVERRSAA